MDYKQAIKNCAIYIRDTKPQDRVMGIVGFTFSEILGIAFEVPKEKVLTDIIAAGMELDKQ